MKKVEILIKYVVSVPDDVSDEVLTEIGQKITCTGECSPEIAYYDDTEDCYDNEETFDKLQETIFESSQFKIPTIHDDWIKT